ncbi:N-acetyl sugar amidotransferase [Tabrizicola sp.]|uniref:N-acetyl sugar amidotransferase n=1 Tax=Tabrizicola sp. TaxID=2005166 RepID=UPI00260DC7A6|nr:N-acetyl sugar amidotransferase [Tabrizicola sp.]MDM7932024.1 N-acetyl sugar amidotransferase [Tabrizicola sp.]
MENRNVRGRYNLPEQVRFCKKCVISNQRPRITFNEQGVCSACEYAEFKRSGIDWDLREQELRELCDRHRRTDGAFDVIVPCSGGKDGSYVAHLLKHHYGMNPLTVTWAPLKATTHGRRNLDAFIASGFSNIMGTPDGKVTRKLTQLATLHLGDPFQPFIYGQTNFPLQVAVRFGVPLIVYGENGEVEYGGDMKNAFRPTREIQDHDKHYFSGLPPEFWVRYGVSETDLYSFRAPPYAEIVRNKTEIHFLGYYKMWDPQENFYYCAQHTGFQPNDVRSEGTYSKYASLDDQIDGFHYYLGYVKFGIGRCTSDAAHEVRDGKIDRSEAVALVRKFDGEFPSRYFKEFLEYCDISSEQFAEIVDSWRADHIWRRTNEGWALRHMVEDIET